MAEPIEVRLQDGAVGLRLGDGMSKTVVEDQARWDVLVLKTAIEFKAIGGRNPLVDTAVLN